MTSRYHLLAAALCAAVTLNACGGSGSNGGLVPSGPATQPSTTPTQPSTPTATFVINVPTATSASSAKRRPQFDSPNTGSVRIALQSANGQPNTSISIRASVGAGAPGCAATSSGLACTVKVGGIVGTDVYAISTYQSSDGSGSALATTTIGVNVSATSSSPTQVSLGGVPASVTFSPSKLPLVNDSNFQRGGGVHRIAVTVNAADASGAPIVGATAYQSPVSLQIQNDPSHALALSTTSVLQPGAVVTVTYDSGKPLQQAQIVASDNGLQGATLLAAPLSVNQPSLTLFDGGTNSAGIQVTEAGFTGAFTSAIADSSVADATLVNGSAGSGNAVVNIVPKSGVSFNTTTLTVGDGNVSVTIPIAVVQHNGQYTAFGSAHTLIAPLGLTKGPDGRLWTSDGSNGTLWAFDTSTKTYTPYTVDPNGYGPSGQFAFDAAGNIWFPDGLQIGEFNPSTSTTTVFPITTDPAVNIQDVIAGPRGSNTMWFYNLGANELHNQDRPTYIGSINTTNGQITEYQTNNNARPNQNIQSPVSMVLGPDNAVWFADGAHFMIDRFDTSSHEFTQYQVSNSTYPSQQPLQLIVGPDGNIWFTTLGGGKPVQSAIGMIDLKSNNTVHTFNEGMAGGIFWNMTLCSDGNIWFTEQKELDLGVLLGVDSFMTFGIIKPAIRTVNGEPSVAYYQYPDADTVTPEFSVISNLLDGGNGTMWTLDIANGQIGQVTFK